MSTQENVIRAVYKYEACCKKLENKKKLSFLRGDHLHVAHASGGAMEV